MHIGEYIPSWFYHLFDCMGGCFSCYDKTPFIVAVDEPSKGLKIQGRLVNKPIVSDGFWSTSTCEMDNNNTMQSQRSMSSSISFTTNNNNTASTSNTTEFINHGGRGPGRGRGRGRGGGGSEEEEAVDAKHLIVIQRLVAFSLERDCKRYNLVVSTRKSQRLKLILAIHYVNNNCTLIKLCFLILCNKIK